MNLTPSPFAPDRFPELPPVKGMRAATASRGFYDDPRDDVFLVAFDEGTTCAGVFTRSTTASADVEWCREALVAGEGFARGLLVNSGNSNAFTGPKGVEKNEASLAAMVTALDVPKAQCFLAATGVIGEPLPDPNYVGSIVPELSGALDTPDWEACARAFMTTDTYPKGASAVCPVDETEVSIVGIAKGSGMIAPNMATMLAYVFTDAAIAPALLDELVREVTERSFNAITVDGDTSTSDTLMVFATGASGAPLIEHRDDYRLFAFAAELNAVCKDLAAQIVRDGEGATKFITIDIAGAASAASAKTIACSVANSPLLKTALAAGDANWGRVVMAVGKSLEPVDQTHLDIHFGDVLVAKGGARAEDYSEEAASAVCAQPEINISIRVGHGPGTATVYTCDLTHAYVDINGAYRT